MAVTRRMLHLMGGVAVTAATSLVSNARASATPAPGRSKGLFAQDWRTFRDQFVNADGRVVDVDNGGVSHSEGQGWALTFAAEADDREAFQRILAWTSRTLRVRDDGLHAWRYVPGAGVADTNNATDGDIFIAYALARAARHWDVSGYRSLAAETACAVASHLVRRVSGRTILLPAKFGFERDGEIVVNPSYYPFFAFEELSHLGSTDTWSRLWAEGLALLAEARFGRFGLPPDWLSIARDTGSLVPASGWPARFSYDAIRIPLYLSLSRLRPPGLVDGLNAYWSPGAETFGTAWVDLHTDAVAPYPSCPGFRAVQHLWLTSQGIDPGPLSEPRLCARAGYFSSALVMLSRLPLTRPTAYG